MKQNESAVGPSLHQSGRDRIREHLRHFQTSLTSYAQIIAHEQKAGAVLDIHADQALERINYSKRCHNVLIESSKIFGSLLLGIGIPKYIDLILEFTPDKVPALVICTVLSFVGLTLLLLGLLVSERTAMWLSRSKRKRVVDR